MNSVTSIVDLLDIDWEPNRTRDVSPFTEGFQKVEPHQPEVIAHPKNRDEVARLVASLHHHDIPVGVTNTGHGRNDVLVGGVLIATDRLNCVAYDPETAKVRVGAGACWRDVIEVVPNEGFILPHGSAPGVGVCGYFLTGGFSIYSRALGLAINSVSEIEIVTWNGEIVRWDHSDIIKRFANVWCEPVRDGVVTEIVVSATQERRVDAGSFFVYGDANRDLLSAFTDWAADLPSSVTPSLGVLTYPDLPVFPEDIRGQTVGHVRYTVVGGDDGYASSLLAPFAEVFNTVAATAGPLLVPDVGALYREPDFAHPYVGDSQATSSSNLNLEALWPSISNQEALGSILDLRLAAGNLSPRPDRVGAPGKWIVRMLAGGNIEPSGALAHIQNRLRDAVPDPLGSVAAFRYGFGGSASVEL